VKIAAVGKGFPEHYYSQEELLAALKEAWADRVFNLERLDRLHENVLVGGRHLALALEQYDTLKSWGDANDAWIEVALEVGEKAILDALDQAGLGTEDVDALFFVTVTGISTPSLDARLMNRLRLRSDVKRVPIFGLGCVAGAAGLARAADYVKAYPKSVAVLLSVELCSLTLQRKDLSMANLISSGLFGDGAAAAVLYGEERETTGSESARPEIVATRSVFYPDSEEVMGWAISESGFQVVLSAEVPEVVRNYLRRDVDAFLADQGLSREEITHWIAHPGGPRVLDAMQESLELPEGALDVTWKSLREIGNVSSTSVLLILQDTLAATDQERAPKPGDLGLLFAMGPGFCSEFLLLRW